jgi:phage terminase small subunit
MRPLTKETKEMQGTLEPSREGFSPVTYEEFEKAPNVPGHWPLEAQSIWRDVWTLLKGSGHMSKGFVMAARALCWAAYRRQLAEERLIALPLDTAWEKILDTNTKTMERLCAKFGLTPADLWKVPAVKKDDTKTMSLLK